MEENRPPQQQYSHESAARPAPGEAGAVLDDRELLSRSARGDLDAQHALIGSARTSWKISYRSEPSTLWTIRSCYSGVSTRSNVSSGTSGCEAVSARTSAS